MFKSVKKMAIKSAALFLTGGLDLYRKFRPLPPRIYFCYNQSIHHIYHSLFVAIELSNIQDTYEIVVLSTSQEASAIIKSELDTIPNQIKFQPVYHPGYNKKDFNIGWFAFFCRLRMQRPAVVVVTDYYDNVFRQLRLKTFWVYLPHGLLNREFGSDPHIRDYDLAIMPGARDLQEFQKRLGSLHNAVIAGYSKLDYLRYHQLQPPALFREKKPVILYNPHFEPQFSSFFDQGRQLMEALAETNKYNLIFMPHPDLARKHPAEIQALKKLSNTVVIDRPKINLDYLAVADVYITDVSSSVFEWLYFDKPALFFNTKKVNWQQDPYYGSWVLGKVAQTIPEMLAAIEEALLPGDNFRATRTRVLKECFANREKPVSRMIADLILDRIKAQKQIPQLFYSGDMGEHTGYGQAFSFLARRINKEQPIRLVCRNMKKLIKTIILNIGYYLGVFELIRLFYTGRGFVPILVYHRVTEDRTKKTVASSFRLKGLTVSPGNFAVQLRYLARKYSVISLEEYIERRKTKADLTGCAVVTFDDGFKDFLTSGWEIIRQYQLPVAMFVFNEALGAGDWLHRLYAMLDQAEAKAFRIRLGDSEEIIIDLNNNAGKYKTIRELTAKLRAVAAMEREEMTRKLAAGLGIKEGNYKNNLYLSEEDLKKLAGQGLSLGAHSASHQPMKDMTDSQLEQEIALSLAFIKELTGQQNSFFAVPFGNCNDRVIAALQKYGCLGNFAGAGGLNHLDEDMYRLRRIAALDVSLAEFAYNVCGAAEKVSLIRKGKHG